jgi:hypothetical protein
MSAEPVINRTLRDCCTSDDVSRDWDAGEAARRLRDRAGGPAADGGLHDLRAGVPAGGPRNRQSKRSFSKRDTVRPPKRAGVGCQWTGRTR